jgi:hypothetical protein
MLDRRAGSESGSAIGRLLDAINPTFVTCSLLVIAAVILILGHRDGIYLLVPALIAGQAHRLSRAPPTTA